MRLWTIIALAAGVVYLVVRHVRGTRHELAIAVLLLPLGFLSIQEYRQRELVKRYADIASEIAGRRVEVRCQGLGGSLVDVGAELGYVPWGPDGEPLGYTFIKHEACKNLAAYAGSDHRRPPLDQIVAVHVLAHEAYHLAGVQEEARAECFSMQLTARVAERLGATRRQGQQLALAYFLRVYPDMPAEYTSERCREGGPMDLHPTDSGWPTVGGPSV